MEARTLLATDALHVGAVYVEQDLGSDLQGDLFEITFVGGADGTALTRVTIDGDQNHPGISVADTIFDTQLGGLGSDESIELWILSQTGIEDVRWFVDDGTSQLILDFVGFDAGDKFVFSVDVDEIQDFEDGMSVEETNEGVDPITSGIEFQGSRLIAEFSADHYFDGTASAEFRNRYDAQLEGSGLDLPADNANGQRDRTAGAVGELVQKPLPAQLSGYVYHDRDDDGRRESGEEGLANVPMRIVPVDTIETQAVITVTTDADGYYQADDLMPGTYNVVEITQPSGYLDGLDSAGTVAGNVVGVAINPGDEIGQIVLKGGESGIDYNFGEVLPAQIEGRVQLSTPDGDCFGDSVEHRPVPGVTIELLDAAGRTIATTATDANGEYSFGDLRPGSYGIREIQPDGLIDGAVNPGTNDGQIAGEMTAQNTVTSIDVLADQTVTDVSFCEHEPVTLSGHVYHDRDNDGRREAGEEGIASVTILLRNENGDVVGETTSDKDGRYRFEELSAGRYTITEVHPTGWVDGRDTAGTVAGSVVGAAKNPGDRIDEVLLQWGDEGEEYNFGELRTATISGRVQLSDRAGDCFGNNVQHAPVVGAVVQILDENGALVAETTTNANGEYHFGDLTPGNYTLVELTPDGLIDGSAQAGHVNGESRGAVVDRGTIRAITLNSGDSAQQYNFCEHQPAKIGGYVYHDRNNDGARDPEEEPIQGVEVILYDRDGNIVARTWTDANGRYEFEGLTPGNYSIEEIQPEGYLDGKDSPGWVNGDTAGIADQPGDRIRQIELGWGDDGDQFNFGELRPAILRGIVHTDVGIRDCDFNSANGDELLAGVRLQLVDASGVVIAETETDSLGRYEFANLEPGTYSIREIQPEGYFDGDESAPEGNGDTSGVNVISDVSVGSGAVVEELNFCEDPPAVLSGYVFQDGEDIVLRGAEVLPERIADVRNGQRTPDDTFLSGVVVELRDGLTGLPIPTDFVLPGIYADGPIRALTDANGFYEFTGLLAGQYSVYEFQPEEYLDGVDTPGTSQGFVFNPGEPTNEAVLLGLQADPLNDAIVRISLRPGAQSFENNFSEIQVVRQRTAVLPPPPPLPPPPIEPNAPPPVLNIPIFEIPSLPDFEVKGFGQMSTDVAGYTWHLSVVDAGHPRGDGMAADEFEEPIWFTATYLPADTGTGRFLAHGQWHFERGANGTPLRKTSFFGMAGGRPVVGDFNGDGVFEVAIFYQGEWFIDINGNGVWDSSDLWAKLGRHKKADLPVTGDWDGDGKDDIGIFGPAWLGDPRAIALDPGLPDNDNPPTGSEKNVPPSLDEATIGNRVMKLTNRGPLRADVIDHVFHYGIEGDMPVVGDWNGDGIQSIGVFRNGRWHLDIDGNGRWTENDQVTNYGSQGDIPVVGDFNGDGIDEIGFFRNGKFYLDTNGNQKLDKTDRIVELGRAGDFPVAGDFDGDGVDDVAVYRAAETHAESVARKAG